MRIETVPYQLDWRKFRKGYSFFVPCIDHEQALAEVHRVTKRLKIKFVSKVVVEDGIKGLRIWRI
jgi:hypothetical protein